VYIVIARTYDDPDEEEVAIKTNIEEGSPSTTAGGVSVIDCSALGTYLQQAEARAVEIGASAMCASATIAVPETAVAATMESIQSGNFANNLGFLMVVLLDDVVYDEPSPPPSASTSTPTESPTASPVVAITGSPTESPVVTITGSPTETPVVEATEPPTELPTEEVVEETGTPTNEPTDRPTATPPTDSPIDETDLPVET
jgi:hypothetical protein